LVADIKPSGNFSCSNTRIEPTQALETQTLLCGHRLGKPFVFCIIGRRFPRRLPQFVISAVHDHSREILPHVKAAVPQIDEVSEETIGTDG
jgi:hypothetical protein